MKKALISLLAIMVLGIPMVVFAFNQAGSVDNTIADSKELEGDKIQQYHDVYVTNSDYTAEDDISVTVAKFTMVSKGSAVEEVSCGDVSGFKAETIKNNDGTVTCKFTSTDSKGVSAEKVKVGQIVVTANKNAADEDCTIQFKFDGTEGKVNPETGASLPYVIIGAGIALAVGVYIVTNRRTKLYKI